MKFKGRPELKLIHHCLISNFGQGKGLLARILGALRAFVRSKPLKFSAKWGVKAHLVSLIFTACFDNFSHEPEQKEWSLSHTDCYCIRTKGYLNRDFSGNL